MPKDWILGEDGQYVCAYHLVDFESSIATVQETGAKHKVQFCGQCVKESSTNGEDIKMIAEIEPITEVTNA